MHSDSYSFFNQLSRYSSFLVVFFPIIGWALAVIGHYLRVFGFPSFRDKNWEQQQMELEIDKLERQQDLDAYQGNTLDISKEKLELRELEEHRQKYDNEDLV